MISIPRISKRRRNCDLNRYFQSFNHYFCHYLSRILEIVYRIFRSLDVCATSAVTDFYKTVEKRPIRLIFRVKILLYHAAVWTSEPPKCTSMYRLSQSRSLGFLVWCGRTRHELSLARASRSLARAPRSYDRASRSQSRYALKSSTCEQV